MTEISAEAIEAAWRAWEVTYYGKEEVSTKQCLRAALVAAAPLIVAATAEAIATAIEAQKAFAAGITRLHALNDAARIARGFAAGGRS